MSPDDNKAQMPTRTMDTMSDAIAISSPNGRMSKKAHAAAMARLANALFGDADIRGEAPRVKKSVMLREHAARLRDLANRGMKPRAFKREADLADVEAAELEAKGL